MRWLDYPPETVALARRLYAENVPTARIIEETGMSLDGLYFWIDGGPPEGERALPPLERRRSFGAKRRRPPAASRKSFIARLWRTAEWQVRDIEERLAVATQEPVERERDARMLGVLVKTLRELAAFDERDGEADSADDDSGPHDIEEFRRELARRMDEIVARRTGGATGEPDIS
jgi:hypothetical protein